MNRKELYHQHRRLVGWWLDVPPALLVPGNSFAQHLGVLRKVVETKRGEYDLEKTTEKINWDKRLRYIESALHGSSMAEIAKEEKVKTAAISMMIRDTLARLALQNEK